jgi:hypothetical protein
LFASLAKNKKSQFKGSIFSDEGLTFFHKTLFDSNKETFVRFYREEISRAKLQEEIYSYKIKDMYIYSDGEIYIYTHIKKIEKIRLLGLSM